MLDVLHNISIGIEKSPRFFFDISTSFKPHCYRPSLRTHKYRPLYDYSVISYSNLSDTYHSATRSFNKISIHQDTAFSAPGWVEIISGVLLLYNLVLSSLFGSSPLILRFRFTLILAAA